MKYTFRRLSAIMFYLHFFNILSAISSPECYDNVLFPFIEFSSDIYRWNRNQVFYLLSSSDAAYLDCVGNNKAFKFAASLKSER